MIQSEENYDTIRTRTARIEYWYGTTQRTVRYDTNCERYRPPMQYIHAWQTPHSTSDPRFVLYFLGEYSTVRYDTNRERYNTIHTANPAQYDTTQYDTTRYEPRVIGLQYNTYMYGQPHTVHMIRGSYCISSGSTVRYDTNRENAGCKPRHFIYNLRDFLLRPDVFHDTIRGSYCISSGRNRIVLQILMSQTNHAPIRTRYDLILTYGTQAVLVSKTANKHLQSHYPLL
jgi:hypothetical protein